MASARGGARHRASSSGRDGGTGTEARVPSGAAGVRRARGHPQPDPESLLTWAESRPPPRRRGLVWVARISPVLLCVFGVAQATDRLSWPVWLVFLFVNVVLWQMRGQRAYATLSRIGTQEPSVRQYVASFDLLSAVTFDAPRLAARQSRCMRTDVQPPPTSTLWSASYAALSRAAHWHTGWSRSFACGMFRC